MAERRCSLPTFFATLDSGDVVNALVYAPFAYTSSYLPGKGFRFTVDDGPSKDVMGVGPTLNEAVHIATWGLRTPARSTTEGNDR